MSRPLRLYNTLTRSKEAFRPIDDENVRLYVCGPTVYDYAHIGNARPLIVFDVLYRLLRHRYGADHVVYARNITDVDDKINARAARDFPALPLNEAIGAVTRATERQFHEDAAALGCLDPDEEPRATGHIAEMVAMIERLVARGLAYLAEDNVLFSPAAMDRYPGVPRYGALARRSLDEMIAGARVDVAPYKRDPMDFVLWKPSKANEPGWPSPCGIVAPGRPGWHIECSAMSMAKLLTPFGGGLACDDPAKNIFDIHGGGIDLVFPHHENEIAQSCCAFNMPRMANVWMHNGFLQVEGEKMSKSLGNFVTIHDLVHTTKFGSSTWPGEVLRLAMIQTHYRQPIDWTVRELERSLLELRQWYDIVKNHPWREHSLDQHIVDALYDDLNTPGAIFRLRELAKTDDKAALRAALDFLGFSCNWEQLKRTVRMDIVENVSIRDSNVMHLPSSSPTAGTAPSSTTYSESDADLVDDQTRTYIAGLIAKRRTARAAKNWIESDRLRDELIRMGVAIKDNADGTTTWEIKR